MFDHKKWVKNGQVSNASYENETHMVDGPFNEDSKNIIFLARDWPLLPGNKVFALLLFSCM